MGIARIGYQGEKFDERVLDRVKYLREANKDVIIGVDGGVSLKTAPQLLSLGATRLVSGSGIFNAENISRAIDEFKAL
jgi:ribulose-phosphate 3-epimerase